MASSEKELENKVVELVLNTVWFQQYYWSFMANMALSSFQKGDDTVGMKNWILSYKRKVFVHIKAAYIWENTCLGLQGLCSSSKPMIKVFCKYVTIKLCLFFLCQIMQTVTAPLMYQIQSDLDKI